MKILKKMIIIIAIFCALIGGLILYSRFIEPNFIITNKVKVQSIAKTQEVKVVFFSDTHFGKFYNQNKIEKIVQKINKQKADVVIFGGDFFDSYYRDSDSINLVYIGEQLKKIQAKYAKIAIWGNHDYGGGSVRIYESLMEDNGFEILKNKSLSIDQIDVTITGIDDYLLGKPETSTDGLTSDKINIFATHAPDVADMIDLENVDFIVAGHSHGGQVSIPFITDKVLPTGAKKYIKGIYTIVNSNKKELLVSKGLGLTKIPYRFGNVPEINVIDINIK